MVLMQTTKADVQNPVNGLRQNARILLDSDSQRTYITESLAKRLNVKSGDKDVAVEGSSELKENPFNIDVKRFSSFTKFCRATAWVIRFTEKLRKRTNLSGPLKSTGVDSICTAYRI